MFYPYHCYKCKGEVRGDAFISFYQVFHKKCWTKFQQDRKKNGT